MHHILTCIKFCKSVSYLEVGVESVSGRVTDGVVEDPDPALVGHLVTHGDQRQVVIHGVQHDHLPVHGGHSQAVRANVGADILKVKDCTKMLLSSS